MSTTNVDLLSRLLLPILILLIVGIVAIIVWLIWSATRPQKDGASGGAQDNARQAADFLSVRHRGQGGWGIYVNGRSYPSLEAVPDPEKRAEIQSALQALAAFGCYQQQVATPGPVDPPPSAAERNRTVLTATAATPQERPVARGATLPTIDLAYEIGEILDEMLPRHPSLQGHAVTLQNRPGHGIAFVVDGAIYQEIADIPNSEIRLLIRDATKEWERR